jgi:hypothetical protein
VNRPRATNYVSSIVALVLGLGLAVGVSSIFGLVGFGGELASQTAGATAGAAPLILDGIRQRRSRGRRQDLRALSRGRQVRPKILVASLFGFAVLFVDSAIGYSIVKATQFAVRVADGDPLKWVSASTALQIVVVLPLVLAATLLLGLAAGHRLGEHRKRWILFGMAIYTVVRMVHLSLFPLPGYSTPVVIASGIVTVGMLTGVALLGAWWARKTQPVFNATAFFRRLPDEDQQAALALLGETVEARDARGPGVSAQPVPGPPRSV